MAQASGAKTSTSVVERANLYLKIDNKFKKKLVTILFLFSGWSLQYSPTSEESEVTNASVTEMSGVVRSRDVCRDACQNGN